METTVEARTRASLLLAAGDPANQKARARFADIYAALIRQACRGKGLQDADQEDVAQAVLCRLFETLPTFRYDPKKRFRGLLHRLIYRAIVDLYRARQRRPGDRGSGDTQVLGRLHEATAPDASAVEDLAAELTRHVAGQMEQDQRLHEACERVRGRVKPHTWQAFWLTTVEGEPVAAVAQRLGMTKDAVTVAKYRTIKMIRSAVEDAAGGDECGARPPGSP